MGPIISVRFSGLQLRAHIATFVVFVVVITGISAQVQNNLLSTFEIAAGSGAAIVSAILAHEYLRVLAYRSQGVRVRGLDLTLIGASPRLVDATNSPRREILAGVAGISVLTIVSAGVFAFRESVLRGSALHGGLTVTATVVGTIAVAQAMPALTLDGGRILRGLVWHLTDDPVKGSRGPAIYGHFIAAAMIGAGAILLVQPGAWPYWGFGLIVAGSQLVLTSAAAVRDAFCQQKGSGLTLDSMVIGWSRRIQASASIDAAVDALIAEGDGPPLLVVDDDGNPIGMLRMRNLRVTRRSQWSVQTTSHMMTRLSDLPEFPLTMNALEALIALDDAETEFAVVYDERGSARFVSRDVLVNQLYAMSGDANDL